VLLAEGPVVTPELLPPEVRSGQPDGPSGDLIELGPEGIDLDELERKLLEEALRRSDGNRTRAGQLLGLSRHQIRNRLKKYGMDE
jgi:two-component system NtrC family response regulator